MLFELSEQQLAVQQAAREFAQNELKPGVIERDTNMTFPTEQVKQMGELGFLGMMVDPKYGGSGMDTLSYVLAMEELSKVDNSASVIMSVNNSLVCWGIEAYGTEEQKEKYIKPTLHGEMIWRQGYSEPNAGSDLASLQTKGELIDGQWVINGQKIWTSTAQYSQMMFCLVRTEPNEKKHAGISYLLIPMDTPGIEVKPLVDMTLKAGFNEVFFTDVKIPEKNIVGNRGDGWAVANATLGHERGSLTDPNATMNRLNALIELMKNETINGKKLIENPVFKDRLLKMQGKVMAFQSNALRVLSAKLNPGQNIKIAGMIQKLVGTELRHELESLGIDIMGELGTLYEDSPNIRDGGSWQFTYMYYLGLIIGGGTNQIQKNIISERGLGMPREPKVTQGVQ